MSKQILFATALLGAACFVPMRAQDLSKFTFNLGGGISTPLNPTGSYSGMSGNFVFGAGYNLNKKNAIIGEFLWSGLPLNRFVINPIEAPFSNINLYSLTANYRHQFERIKGSPFGVYTVMGGGWYHRYTSIDKNYTVAPGTPCMPIYSWWGYTCDPYGYVYTQTVAAKGVSAGGLNGGVGFTIRFADSNFRFFTEARYHYAFSERIPTTLIPVTFGFRYN
jgi:hypothetical protein